MFHTARFSGVSWNKTAPVKLASRVGHPRERNNNSQQSCVSPGQIHQPLNFGAETVYISIHLFKSQSDKNQITDRASTERRLQCQRTDHLIVTINPRKEQKHTDCRLHLSCNYHVARRERERQGKASSQRTTD